MKIKNIISHATATLGLLAIALSAHAAAPKTESITQSQTDPKPASKASLDGKQVRESGVSTASKSRQDASSSLRDLPLVIRAMIEKGQGVNFLNIFVAGSGMTGYVLSSNNGERRIFYVTPDKRHAFLGLMFDEKLNNLTAGHQRDYIDLTEFFSAADGSYKEHPADIARRLLPVATEGSGLEVQVFVDFASPEFVSIYKASRAYLGGIRLSWMASPHASVRGRELAIAVLASSDPAATLGKAALLPAVSVAVSAKERASGMALFTKVDDAKTGVPTLRLPAFTHHGLDDAPYLLLGVPGPAQWKAWDKEGVDLLRLKKPTTR